MTWRLADRGGVAALCGLGKAGINKSVTQNFETALSPLARGTSRGFAWMAGQTLGSQTALLIGRIFLARLLMPRDFGLIALAYMAVVPATMLRQTGMVKILIQKGEHFNRWANAGFWMDLSLGLLAVGVMLISAPLAADIFHAPPLLPLLAVIATTVPLDDCVTVPLARLTMDLRFRELALVGVTYNIFTMAGSVACAYLGLGVYSFVLPVPIGLALRALVMWRLAPVRLALHPQLHRWRAMAADSARLLGTGVFTLFQGMANILALGLFWPQAVVGFYSFAGNLAAQMVQLFAVNLAAVLFPVLSALKHEPPRQMTAFVHSTRALALLGVPLCLGGAVLAHPLMAAVFGAKWLPAAPLLQVLALAAAVNLAALPAGNLMQAQGRFHLNMQWSIASAILFAALVFTAAKWGNPLLVATAELLGAVLIVPARLFAAIRPSGGRIVDVAGIYLPSLLLSAAALAPAAAGEFFCPWLQVQHWIEIAFAVVTALPIYVLLVRRFRRNDFEELMEHLRPMLG